MVLEQLAPTAPLFLLTGLVTGIKHGVDRDHIAAISDITSAQNKISNGISMSFLNGLGDAGVVVAIARGIIILVYSLGLVMTNTIMAALGAYGYIKSGERQRLYSSAAFITGTFSMKHWLANSSTM